METPEPLTPPFVNYLGMVMVAPMVRISALGFRMFVARCGSDVVFSEELVAAKLAKCVREVRRAPPWLLSLAGSPREEGEIASVAGPGHWDRPFSPDLPSGTELVEFVHYERFKGGMKRVVVFTTLRVPDEHRRRIPYPEGRPVVLQLGAAEPQSAARAAALVCDDVDAIDLNMGCPKKFSVSNGMGASLMTDVDRAERILRAIRDAVGPTKLISVKTRLFENPEESLSQLSRCIVAGALHSVTIHARFRSQRSDTRPQIVLAETVARRLRSLFPRVALVYNGSLGCSGLDCGGDIPAPVPGQPWAGRDGILSAVNALGYDGGLIARDAMWNPTVLLAASSGYSGNYTAVFRRLLEYHASCGTSFAFLKYHLTRTFGQGPLQSMDPVMYRTILSGKDVTSFAVALGIEAAEADRLQQRFEWFGGTDEASAAEVQNGGDLTADADCPCQPRRPQPTE